MPTLTSADTIRILVATDSHVGYEERDPIRKDDSWKSFDEVMKLAKSEDVDMILLAGDLFHENKPSRKSMYQVMRSLRMNCLGEKPCELEMLSDPAEVLDGAHVNYEDPDINVAIPAFSIHGNHDDPTGDGHYCSLDLLQVSGLLNYIGRIPETDKLEVKPVLLQKGQTKLALYGMSNVRDERLFRTFRDGNVKFFKPGQQQKDWFNLMAVHQNHHAHNETGYLPENFLPDFMDLVVWGHEHECLIDPRLNPEMQFHVMQPGSSVATSLVAGEAVAKHVAVLSVTGKEFKIEKHRLQTVRPFVTRDIILAEEPRFKKLAMINDNRTQITNELTRVVDKLIEQATSEWEAIQDQDDPPEETPLPLVRLRVEYSAPDGGRFDCENPQRFSNKFQGRVANVNDVVQFHMKKTNNRKEKIEKGMPEEAVIAAMSTENVKVDKLAKEFLLAQSLKILPQTAFGDAVGQFVEKDDKYAVEQFVNETLSLQIKGILAFEAPSDDEDIDPFMEQIRQKQEEAFASGVLKRPKRRGKLRPRPNGWDSDAQGEWEDTPGAYEPGDENDEAESDDNASLYSVAVASKKAPAKKPAAKRAPAKAKAPSKAKAAPKAKAPAKAPARGRKKAVVSEPSDDEDLGDEDVTMFDEAPPPKKPQPKRAAAPTKGRQTQLSFSQPSKTQVSVVLSDDEISDEDAFEPMTVTKKRR